MNKNALTGAAVIAVIFCAFALPAQATIIDFSSGTTGPLTQSVTIPPLTLTAWRVNKITGIWSNSAILDRVNNPTSDVGLGVCVDGTQANCPTSDGSINEIDNRDGAFEVIRLDFGTATTVQAIGLSSLESPYDNYAIFGGTSANVNPNLSGLAPIAHGNATVGNVNPEIAINQSYRYFYVTTDARGCTDTTSNFLLRDVQFGVPEPFTMSLMGAGLIGLGLLRRLRKSA